VAIECYVKLLEYEGRLHTQMICFLCNEKIEKNISLVRAFLPTHKKCTHTLEINKKALMYLYETKSTLLLQDYEIERMWIILLEGL
jgi:hypothetical protein